MHANQTTRTDRRTLKNCAAYANPNIISDNNWLVWVKSFPALLVHDWVGVRRPNLTMVRDHRIFTYCDEVFFTSHNNSRAAYSCILSDLETCLAVKQSDFKISYIALVIYNDAVIIAMDDYK